MAKAKKAKIDEQKGAPDDNSNSSEAVVKHQKLSLYIDMEQRRIYGYTELQIVVPENGIVGLHADNLVIEKVTVDGEAAEFEVFPHYQHLDPKNRWCVVSSATSAADASGSVYLSALELELLPNLLIMCSKPENKQQEYSEIGNSDQSCPDATRNVRIEYWVEKTETGIHFNNDVLHTDNQLRRARCWFPCMDDSLQCCCYDLEFTVANNLVAVSSGTLIHQVLTKDDPPRKTYVYRLDVPVAPQWISLVVAPFEIISDRHGVVSDRHGGLLSHFCLPANLSKLRNTVAFFYNAFSHYEDYLSTSFPFGSYKHVFVAPEMAVSSCSVGASISIFSSHMLFDEKIIDQTIGTRTKLAYALARQWFGVYITPEAPNDEWLLDGLAWFLTDSFIKRSLGNNEARFRRYKANCAVCLADDSGATALSSSTASKDLYGTQCIGFYGKIRSWKSVAVLQMLEKQMGPESFRKILQNIILRARDGTQTSRTLSTKEFRHSANKIGNLERPFLKEFFPRWIGSCGCPVLKMGYTYNKRKNMVELAVMRGCTYKPPDSLVGGVNSAPDSENSIGWPGMMSIRVHELDGMYDHPILSMAGERCQLLDIQCHSKLASKRFQKTKKGSKAEGSDDNNDATATTDVRLNSDSPLLWLRADPELEYLGEVHFNQPAQNWINQLEKDKDVIAQAQAIAVLEALPQLSFSAVNALNNFLCDSKAFWRIRVQAAYALATTTSEETDWAGLLHLINFYKSKRFDLNIGLPRPNDFHDIQEYFVLEAIPHAIALVRSSDNKSPTEAVEFILQLLKYNDNNGNVYSDVFWLAALVRSVGELEYGQQSIAYLPSLLKRLDRLLQFDRLMPSHNGILTVSCIQSLTQIVLKLSDFVPPDSVVNLIKPYRGSKTWQIRVDASRALLELEFQSEGIDAALSLFIKYVNDEISLRGQTKLGVCMLRLSQMGSGSEGDNNVKSDTLVALLRLLESPIAFNNITLRHYIFSILQVLAGRPPTLFGVPRDETLRMGHVKTCNELKNIFAALINHSKNPPPPEVHLSTFAPPDLHEDASHNLLITSEGEVGAPVPADQNNEFATNNTAAVITIQDDVPLIPTPRRTADSLPLVMEHDLIVESHDELIIIADDTYRKEEKESEQPLVHDGLHVTKEADIVSNSNEIVVPNSNEIVVPSSNEIVVPKKPSKLKIRVKQPAATQASNENTIRILTTAAAVTEDGTGHNDKISNDADHGASSSTINRNLEEEAAHSSHDIGSRLTASIGSAKPIIDDDELLKCTADSSSQILSQTTTPTAVQPQTSGHTYSVDIIKPQDDNKGSSGKEKKKDKERKRKKHDHGDDVERKRQKKEKKRKKKELAKLLANKSADKVAGQERGDSVAVLEAGPSSSKPEPRRETTASSAEELPGKTVNLGGVQPVPAASRRETTASYSDELSGKTVNLVGVQPVPAASRRETIASYAEELSGKTVNLGGVQPVLAVSRRETSATYTEESSGKTVNLGVQPVPAASRRETTASYTEELSGKTINLGGSQPVPAASSQPNVVPPQSNPSHKIKIKFKNRTLGKP